MDFKEEKGQELYFHDNENGEKASKAYWRFELRKRLIIIDKFFYA